MAQQPQLLFVQSVDCAQPDPRGPGILTWLQRDCRFRVNELHRLSLMWGGVQYVSLMGFDLTSGEKYASQRLCRISFEYQLCPAQSTTTAPYLHFIGPGGQPSMDIHFTPVKTRIPLREDSPPPRQQIPLVKKTHRIDDFNRLMHQKQRQGKSPSVRLAEHNITMQLEELFASADFKLLRTFYSEPNRTCPNDATMVRFLSAQYDEPDHLFETTYTL